MHVSYFFNYNAQVRQQRMAFVNLPGTYRYHEYLNWKFALDSTDGSIIPYGRLQDILDSVKSDFTLVSTNFAFKIYEMAAEIIDLQLNTEQYSKKLTTKTKTVFFSEENSNVDCNIHGNYIIYKTKRTKTQRSHIAVNFIAVIEVNDFVSVIKVLHFKCRQPANVYASEVLFADYLKKLFIANFLLPNGLMLLINQKIAFDPNVCVHNIHTKAQQSVRQYTASLRRRQKRQKSTCKY